MQVNWIEILATDVATADTFYDWIVAHGYDPAAIFGLDSIEGLLGIMILYLADEHDIVIHVDRSCYIVAYGSIPAEERKVKSYPKFNSAYIAEWYATAPEEVTTIQVNYDRAISHILTELTKLPF